MEKSVDDVDNYRMKHESNKEWHMRRAFLLAHRDKFSDSRLRCLSSCYINVDCYGCRYPDALMRHLEELKAELPKQSSQSSGKRGMPQSIKFVPAGQAVNKSSLEASQSSAALPVRVGEQQCANKSSDTPSPCSAKVSKLEASFHCLAEKLKEVYNSKSLTESKNVTELVQIAIDKARMSTTTQFAELDPGKGFRCDLSIDFVLVSSGEAQNKRLAKHSAFIAAADILRKPHLRVSEEVRNSVRMMKLVNSQESSVEGKSLRQLLSRESGINSLMDKGPAHSTDSNGIHSGRKRSSDVLHGGSLKDFVILRPNVTEANAVSVLQTSADFNKWSLEYDMSEMSGGFHRCRATLGGHLLSDAVSENKAAAKTTAAEQALKQLASTCCTVCVKKLGDEDLDDTLKRSEVDESCTSCLGPTLV